MKKLPIEDTILTWSCAPSLAELQISFLRKKYCSNIAVTNAIWALIGIAFGITYAITRYQVIFFYKTCNNDPDILSRTKREKTINSTLLYSQGY